ncbi:MAG: hypothetical protein QM747_19245 [Nocardioides sp.]
MRKRILAVLAALILALGLAAPAQAEVGNSGDNTCTTSNFHGSNFIAGNPTQGSWSRTYNANCNNYTVGSIEISWSNYICGLDHCIKWNADISAGAIAGNACIYVTLDWRPPNGGHSDSQTVRNCSEYTDYTPGNLPQIIHTGNKGSPDWAVWRLQIGTYDPDTGDVTHVVCPSSSDAPSETFTTTGCTGYQSTGAPSWSSKSAKIYRKGNAGVEDNNLPKYPEDCNYFYQTQADQ